MKTSKLCKEILSVIPPSMRAIRNEMRSLAQPELTIAQFRILTRLDIYPHTNKEMAEWMGISAASLCRTIDILVKRGHVTRKTAVDDRRNIQLVLTAKGKKKYESIETATERMLQEKISVLSKKDQNDLQTGLELLRQVFPEALVK
jgi:DNA-binding MarR family transcriptional regulator